MRKIMNKKGFSLVELMIVVVIMGILIAVAVPLYGAITENANNKTCATNIETIKNTCANYYISTDPQTVMPDADTLKNMTEDKEIPFCPIENGVYGIYVDKNDQGRATVICPNIGDDHPAAKTGSDTTAPTGDNIVVIQALADQG